MLRKTAVLAGSAILVLAPLHLAAQDAPLRLELASVTGKLHADNMRLVTPGDGYLMLLHVASGRVHVMFPVTTGGPSALPAGDYTLDRLGIDMPWANGLGPGVIVAAWSPTLIRTNEFVRYGHWAVSDLSRKAFTADPAVATIDLVTRLGATPGAVASVEYGSIRTFGAPRETASRSYAPGNADDYPWKVYQNLFRILSNCPSADRDLNGEPCGRREPLYPGRRIAPPAEPEQEPVDRPGRPVYSPPPPVTPTPASRVERPAPPPPNPPAPGRKQPL